MASFTYLLILSCLGHELCLCPNSEHIIWAQEQVKCLRICFYACLSTFLFRFSHYFFVSPITTFVHELLPLLPNSLHQSIDWHNFPLSPASPSRRQALFLVYTSLLRTVLGTYLHGYELWFAVTSGSMSYLFLTMNNIFCFHYVLRVMSYCLNIAYMILTR